MVACTRRMHCAACTQLPRSAAVPWRLSAAMAASTSTYDRSSFGTVLQRLRRRAGLSQQELAERAGLSLRGIADLERGARRSPYPATVRRLIQALDLNDADRAALLDSAGMSEPVVSPTQAEQMRSLPRPLSTFIGREHEKAAIQRLLKTARLVTLTGTGGIGKTRLAIEVAASNDSSDERREG